MTPPRLAERLLAATVRDDGWRDSILGDLREEWTMIRRQSGDRAARRWYWRQALTIGAGRMTSRLRARRASHMGIAGDAELGTRAGWWAGFTRDVRYAARAMWRRPATSAVIVVTLTLALGATSTSYAVLDALVLRPFRFPDVDRLVIVASSDPQQGLFDRQSVAPADFQEWKRRARTVVRMAAAEWWDANLSGIDVPEPVPGFRVSADFFPALGVTLILGRTFAADEETPGRHRRVVLGHGLWTRLFGADPALVGRTVRLDGEPYEVVGIAPPGFALPSGAQVWAPLAYTGEEWADRRGTHLEVVGRLADGATLSEARAELSAIAAQLRREFPDTNANRPHALVSFTQGMADPGAGAFLATMAAASLLLLLIACANIANLLLARGMERTQEFAMRLALGASRARLTWQLLLESALISIVAIAAALPVTWLFLLLSRRSIPASVIRFVPGYEYMDVSPAVLAATAACAAAATVLSALIPALQTVRKDVADALRQGTRATTAPPQRHRLRSTLAAAQVALTLALLFGSGLLLSATDTAINGSLGFDKRNLLVARVSLPERPYAAPERRRQFVDGALERLQALPAVKSAAMVSHMPYTGNNHSRAFYPDGRALELRDVDFVDYRRVTPAFLEAMGLPLRAGRRLTPADRDGARQVALVSQSLVDRYWPDDDALGRTFRTSLDGPEVTIVGVVGDVLQDWFQGRRGPTVYRPVAQEASYSLVFLVRTIGDPASVAGDLRRAVQAQDPDQPILSLQSMEQAIEERTAGLTFISGAISVVAGIALVLAVMGLYSLMAFVVSRRRQELGVRLALGATRGQVVGLTTRQALRVTVAGLIVGALLAFALGRAMEALLYGVVVASVWQLAVLCVMVAGTAALASYLPARRVARLDPTEALRAE